MQEDEALIKELDDKGLGGCIQLNDHNKLLCVFSLVKKPSDHIVFSNAKKVGAKKLYKIFNILKDKLK